MASSETPTWLTAVQSLWPDYFVGCPFNPNSDILPLIEPIIQALSRNADQLGDEGLVRIDEVLKFGRMTVDFNALKEFMFNELGAGDFLDTFVTKTEWLLRVLSLAVHAMFVAAGLQVPFERIHVRPVNAGFSISMIDPDRKMMNHDTIESKEIRSEQQRSIDWFVPNEQVAMICSMRTQVIAMV